MSIKALMVIAMFCSLDSYAGFPPFTDVQPDVVYEGQEVFVGYDPLQTPCLRALPNFQGLTEYIVMDEDNFIDITIVALGTSPCLNIGVDNPPYQYYSLGRLPIGEYTVQMYWAGSSTALPVGDPSERLTIGELLEFRVVQLAEVPVLGFELMLLLAGLFLLVGIYRFRAVKFF
ncbi:hypothetical protein ACFODZ_03805 [Marinicella sediminis]|uniref:IPTL-CTERM sorting domain-containing protein n=1 Tax=Marinicella sediminis TaxID=1792834 RepID=A0ABV7J8X7_9GAMM|nr:hypothetical protein [Marinicella sediminis]